MTLHADGSSITISDDGRGIPVDKHPKTKKSALEVIFTVLHAGGKFEHGNYKTAGGLHGVGASVVNALSTELRARVKRDGAEWEMSFKRGQVQGALKKVGAARGSGTTVYFHPDSTIFPKVEFDPALIRERLEIVSYIHKGVKVTFENEGGEDKEVFQHDEGLSEFLKKIVGERGARAVHESAFVIERDANPASSWRCSGPSPPTSTSAASSTAFRPDRVGRTRTASAPGSARRCATTSTRTTCRPRASRWRPRTSAKGSPACSACSSRSRSSRVRPRIGSTTPRSRRSWTRWCAPRSSTG